MCDGPGSISPSGLTHVRVGERISGAGKRESVGSAVTIPNSTTVTWVMILTRKTDDGILSIFNLDANGYFPLGLQEKVHSKNPRAPDSCEHCCLLLCRPLFSVREFY